MSHGQYRQARRVLLGVLASCALVLLPTVQTSASPPQCDGGVHPDPGLSGRRVRAPKDSAVYLVDPDGYRRWIPGAVDYEALFGDNWSGIVATSEVNCIQARPPLRVRTDQCCGAVLIRGADTAGVYLYVDDTKRWIPSPAEFDKYSFNWDRIVVFPEVWMDEIPAGPAWT